MRKLLAFLLLGLLAPAALDAARPQPPMRRLEKVNVLPLALDDRYQFRKVEQFLNDPRYFKPTVDAMIQFERDSTNYGAITAVDRLELRGNYYTFFWKTKAPGPLTVRFEYRQANLGSYVQAQEIAYDDPRGVVETKFKVIGDEYNTDGRVISWRAILISGGKIVGLTQSYLWN